MGLSQPHAAKEDHIGLVGDKLQPEEVLDKLGVKSTIDLSNYLWYVWAMSRPLRIDYPNAWHHVMNRARRGVNLFVDKADYQQFIDLLQETADLFKVNVAAFCLMPTHYHLMVQTPDANLSRCMRHLNGVYTQRYNVRHDSDGTLFRGRYKSILVEADSYVLQLVGYIHRNPLKAGLVKRLDQYVWSSHKGYLSKAKKWNWLYMRSEPLMRVGAGFGLNRYSSVSSAIVRKKIKLQKDRKFKDRLEGIKNNILKGQT